MLLAHIVSIYAMIAPGNVTMFFVVFHICVNAPFLAYHFCIGT